MTISFYLFAYAVSNAFDAFDRSNNAMSFCSIMFILFLMHSYLMHYLRSWFFWPNFHYY